MKISVAAGAGIKVRGSVDAAASIAEVDTLVMQLDAHWAKAMKLRRVRMAAGERRGPDPERKRRR